MVAQGTTLAGRYRLDTRIGAGGMGEVWRGEDIVLARTVAVKVLLPGRMDDPGFVARFQAEARAMATINHPGVVDVYDYGVSGDTVYLVMKFVDGEPLDRLLARLGRIPPQSAMELIAQAASALQAVHDQGIVHRDVKPGNLLVQRDGTLVLTDFGIARSDLANRLTDAGMVLGTAAYCAPEQAEGAPVTPAVDVYALGVVAYECLVGQRPFDGDSAVTIALKHIREAPPPLPAEIPPPVRALVERALSKDPDRRHPSAKAMSEAARQAAAGQPATPEPVAPVTGATMAPPVEAYQTGAHQAAPEEAVATVAGQRQPGSRRAAKARRRGGLVAGIAAAVVLGAGATAIALTGMTTEGDPDPTKTASNAAASEIITHAPTRTRTTKPAPTPKETHEEEEPPSPTREPEPDPDPTTHRATRTPTSTPSATPSTTKKPTSTPSATKKPVEKKPVPAVVDLPYLDARKIVLAAGFTIKTDDQTQGKTPPECLMVGETFPKAGEELEVRKPVSMVLIPAVSCPTGTASPTPTGTVR
ncbi:protein kinase [Nonomuraea sp. NPDC000554]|uniref:serine/threonine-protein kinase n=1 Tax=Nonomuraea sp. NPDC000554 TaxID=3154259 RepID=UPI003323DBF3